MDAVNAVQVSQVSEVQAVNGAAPADPHVEIGQELQVSAKGIVPTVRGSQFAGGGLDRFLRTCAQTR